MLHRKFVSFFYPLFYQDFVMEGLIRRLSLLLSLFTFLWLEGGCQSLNEQDRQQDLKLIKTAEATVPVGATFAIRGSSPKGLQHQLLWQSSDPSIATVNSYGIVSTHKEGEIVISVRNGSYVETCALNITSADYIGSFVFVNSDNVGANQSMVIYSDFAVFFNNTTNSAKLYDLKKGSLLDTFELFSGSYHNPHCNTACLGYEYVSHNSIMPLIYISQWDEGYERACFVYDISSRNNKFVFTLAQRINLSKISDSIIGEGPCDFAVDVEAHQLVAISYRTHQSDSLGTATIINKFPLPLLSDGEEVFLNDCDLIDSYTLPLFPYRQDIVSYGDKFFMNMGGIGNEKARLVVIDKKDMQVVSILPLYCVRDSEPEGIAVHNGLISLTFGDSQIYSLW